jgi:hypothetical protein
VNLRQNAAHTHYGCFFEHPESLKLTTATEIQGLSLLPADDAAMIKADFGAMRASAARGMKGETVEGGEEGGDLRKRRRDDAKEGDRILKPRTVIKTQAN